MFASLTRRLGEQGPRRLRWMTRGALARSRLPRRRRAQGLQRVILVTWVPKHRMLVMTQQAGRQSGRRGRVATRRMRVPVRRLGRRRLGQPRPRARGRTKLRSTCRSTKCPGLLQSRGVSQSPLRATVRVLALRTQTSRVLQLRLRLKRLRAVTRKHSRRQKARVLLAPSRGRSPRRLATIPTLMRLCLLRLMARPMNRCLITGLARVACAARRANLGREMHQTCVRQVKHQVLAERLRRVTAPGRRPGHQTRVRPEMHQARPRPQVRAEFKTGPAGVQRRGAGLTTMIPTRAERRTHRTREKRQVSRRARRVARKMVLPRGRRFGRRRCRQRHSARHFSERLRGVMLRSAAGLTRVRSA